LIEESIEESPIERHDLYNFESKIEYTYSKEKVNKKKPSYLIDTYFFIPKSLQINKETYSKEEFYSDLNNNIRFKTPKMSIEGILDKDNNLSPINVICAKIKEIEYGNISSEGHKKIQRELKLLGCIIKSSLRDQFSYFQNYFEQYKESVNSMESLRNYIKSIEKLQTKMDYLREKFAMAQIPFDVRETFRYSDEYISYQIEAWLTSALKTFEKEFDVETQKSIIKMITIEQSYRKSVDSRISLKEGSDNEEFTYMESIMKKYLQSVLYLEKKKKDPKSSSLQMIYSIAAGLAMFLSLLLGLILLLFFNVNDIPYILGLVVIYMLKDRIKDIIHNSSQKALGLFFPDARVDIIDGFFKEKIGVSKEKVLFLNWEKIPVEVLKIRESSNISPIEKEGKPEVCILHKKKITLFRQRIDKHHTRQKDISDVIRFNITDFLKYADDPVRPVLNWNENKNQVELVPVSKFYHLNLILKLTTFDKRKPSSVYFKKYRVILDQKGIRNVMEIKFTI